MRTAPPRFPRRDVCSKRRAPRRTPQGRPCATARTARRPAFAAQRGRRVASVQRAPPRMSAPPLTLPAALLWPTRAAPAPFEAAPARRAARGTHSEVPPDGPRSSPRKGLLAEDAPRTDPVLPRTPPARSNDRSGHSLLKGPHVHPERPLRVECELLA